MPRLVTMGRLGLEGSAEVRVEPRPLLLLAYLAIEGHKTRTHLSELFWPKVENPRPNLSTSLSKLRKLGEGVVRHDADDVWTEVSSDYKDFFGALVVENYARAFDLFARPLFGDADAAASRRRPLGEELQEWISDRRDAAVLEVGRARLKQATAVSSQGQFDVAAQHASEAYRLLEYSGQVEQDDLALFFTLLKADDHHLAKEIAEQANDLGISLHLTAAQARLRLRPSLVGRRLERKRLLDMAPGEWAWVEGAAGMGKTALLRSLPEDWRRLRGRTGLPYATLTPVIPVAPQEGRPQILRHLARARGTWLIDDWEYMDDESRALLRDLRDTRPPALTLIITSREPAPLRVDHEIRLGPLPRPALADLPGAWERTEGVPGLVGAFLRNEPLGEAFDKRLASLDSVASRVYLALTLSREATPPLVRAALDISGEAMAQALQTLTATGLVEPPPSYRVHAREEATRYLSKHLDTFRQLAIRLARVLEPAEAVRLYEQVREFWGEDLTAIRAAYVSLGEALLRSGEPKKVSEWLRHAPSSPAVRLLQARALDKIGRYREALELLGDDEESPEVLSVKAALYWRLGRTPEARRAANQGLKGDLEARAQSLKVLGHLSRSKGRYQEAGRNAKRAADLWKKLERPVDYAGSLSDLALTSALAGEDAEAAFAQVQEEVGENPLLRGIVELNLGLYHESRYDRSGGDKELLEAGRHYLKSIEHAAVADAADTRALGLMNLGVLYHRGTRLAYQRALEPARESGDHRTVGMILANLAELNGDFDAWRESLRLLEVAGHHHLAQEIRQAIPDDHAFKAKLTAEAMVA